MKTIKKKKKTLFKGIIIYFCCEVNIEVKKNCTKILNNE